MLNLCSDPRRLSVFTPRGLDMSAPVNLVAAFRTGWHAHRDQQMSIRQHAAETAAAFADDIEVLDWTLHMMGAEPAGAAAVKRLASSASTSRIIRRAETRGETYVSAIAYGMPAVVLLLGP